LEDYKYNVKSQLTKPDENLRARFNRVFEEISSGTLEFDRRQKLINAIDTISPDEIKSAFNRIFFENPQKLSFQLFNNNSTIITNSTTEDYSLNNKTKSKVILQINPLNSELLPIYNKTYNDIYATIVSRRKNFIKKK
jgi:secreted Zn-dependent insulinase-like peptidase